MAFGREAAHREGIERRERGDLLALAELEQRAQVVLVGGDRVRRQPALRREPLQERCELVLAHGYSVRMATAEHLAEAREEVHALARMEVIGIVAADDQEPEPRLGAERHERRGGHGVGIALEDVLLPIAQRTAARLRRAQERRERPHVGIVGIHAADEAFAHGPGRRIGEQHEHGALGGEVLAQPRLELLEPRRRCVGARMSFKHS